MALDDEQGVTCTGAPLKDASSKQWYVVPVTIADERLVAVKAASAKEAVAKVRAGKYARLGRSRKRGFLLVGEAEEVKT